MRADLSRYDRAGYAPGRGIVVRALWYLTGVLFISNPLNPFSGLKVALLRLFGATIGAGVVLKPRLWVTNPWNIEIGSHTWVGEGAWLHALGKIRVGSNVCVSQDAYLETGSHDWTHPRFRLIVAEVVVEDGAWIGARAMVLPGVTVGADAVVTAGSVASRSLPPGMICRGNPAVPVRKREIA